MDECVGGVTGKVEGVRNQMQDGFKAIADNLKDHADKNNETSSDIEYFERKMDDAAHNTGE